VRFIFGKNIDVAAAVTWANAGEHSGHRLCCGERYLDQWISPAVALVGEFIPSAGPNLIFAAILVPILVAHMRLFRNKLADNQLRIKGWVGFHPPLLKEFYARRLALS